MGNPRNAKVCWPYLIKRAMDYCRENNVDVLEGLSAVGGVALVVLLTFAGVAVAVVILIVVTVCLVWFCSRISKWRRRRLAKKRYGRFDQCLTTENQVIRKNAQLGSLFVTSARLIGRSIAGDGRAVICRSSRSPTESSFQLQFKDGGGLGCVHVVLEQVGKDVVARADWAARASHDQEIGYDFMAHESICQDSRIPIVTSRDGDGYGVVCIRFRAFSVMRPQGIPLAVCKGGGLRWLWSVSRSVPEAIKVDVSSSVGCSDASIRVENTGCKSRAEIVWRHPERNCGEAHGGVNLKKANLLVIKARGEVGGENVCFFMGGLRGRMVPDTAEEHACLVSLKKKWRVYRIPLHDVDLTRIKTAFGLRMVDREVPSACYIDNVAYKHSMWRAVAFGLGRFFRTLARCIKFLMPSRQSRTVSSVCF